MVRPLLPLLCVAALLLAGCGGQKGYAAPTSAPATASEHGGLLVTLDGHNGTAATPAALQRLAFQVHATGMRGGEPNIGITPKGNAYVTAGGLVLKSADHGRSWTEAFNLTRVWGDLYDPAFLPNSWPAPVCETLPVTPPLVGCPGPDPVRGLTRSSDPQLWVDPDTGRVFADFMTGLYCSKMFFSDDEGATWTASPVDCGVPVNDHQKVATAHWGPDVPTPAVNPVYPNVVYYCYNKLAASDCAVSLDGGMTFNYDRPATVGAVQQGEQQALAAMGPCGGINGHPAGAPDGTVYLPINLGCPGPVVMVSTTNGAVWTLRQGPTVHGAEEIDPDVTVTPDGTAYMLYRGSDHLPYLVRSHDRFATWQGPWLVAPPDVRSSVFSGITSGDDGRIAMAFLGTRDTAEEPSLAPNATRWHLYNVVSLDAAADSPTFTAVQVTPDADPVQIGCVWLNGGGNPCRNLLDFIDLHRGPDGRAYTVFTDGCAANCAHNATATHLQSRSRIITVSVLDGGPSLLAGRTFEGEAVPPGRP
ncbi:MAG TPA: sialidase family protein [Candidatus Thermoplasmatota archaeon]|nr:sialidase family protein [Candidatus Thermoplasmatota archaeon]